MGGHMHGFSKGTEGGQSSLGGFKGGPAFPSTSPPLPSSLRREHLP